MKPRRHVLLVSFPVLGNINPALQFAQKLINAGIDVTFATTVSARRSMVQPACSDAKNGLKFVTFSDGTVDGYELNNDGNLYMSELRNGGVKTMKEVIQTSSEQGQPITYMVYSLLLPWAAEVAREANIPSALLWAQPAIAFDVYYYYFHGFKDEIQENFSDPTWKIQLPGIPFIKLSQRELPTLVLPTSSPTLSFVLAAVQKKLEILDSEAKPIVLVNTFDALEPDALKSIGNYELIGIGPLIPPALSEAQDSCGDLSQWLNSKKESSVVYVAFGSMVTLPRSQMEEIAKGLMDSGRPFLWVIRTNGEDNEDDDQKSMMNISCMQNLGKIVPWCCQLEVLKHRSLGCFVTHCGWNSTLESISCGVPMVAFPRYADQGTNAKLVGDVWKVGVRVKVNENGLVESDEIRSCIDKVMDGGHETGTEIRENARKWKGLAREAMEEDGSSTNNLKAFLREIRDGF